MTWSSTRTLSIVELIVFIAVVPLVLYLWRAHGRPNLLGSLYMTSYCLIRIIADILTLAENSHNGKPSTTEAVLSAIGLSPLTLMLAGFAHYIHVLRLESKLTSNGSPTTHRWTRVFLVVFQAQIHAVSGVAVYLTVTASLDLFEHPETLTESQLHSAEHRRDAGAIIFLFLCTVLTIYLLYLSTRARRNTFQSMAIDRLSIWTLAACAPVGIRSLYTVIYTFDHKDTSLSPIIGKVWVKVVFIFLIGLVAIVCTCTGAYLSRHIRVELNSSVQHSSVNKARPVYVKESSPEAGTPLVPVHERA